MHIVDLYPTLVKLAGGRPESDLPLDGRDVWPCIVEGAPSPHEDILINAEKDRGALREGDWKLVVFEPANAGRRGRRRANQGAEAGQANGAAADQRRIELYDLARDVGETKNVADRHPDVVADLLARYERYLAESIPALDLAGKKPVPTPKVWGEVTATR
jgi:arylsulfatase A-like enzyme